MTEAHDYNLGKPSCGSIISPWRPTKLWCELVIHNAECATLSQWFESASVIRISNIPLNGKIFALIVHTNWKCVSGTWVLTYRIGGWSRFRSQLAALGGMSGWLPVPWLCPRVSCEGLGWTINQVWPNGWASPMLFWWARQMRLGAGPIKSSCMKIKSILFEAIQKHAHIVRGLLWSTNSIILLPCQEECLWSGKLLVQIRVCEDEGTDSEGRRHCTGTSWRRGSTYTTSKWHQQWSRLHAWRPSTAH